MQNHPLFKNVDLRHYKKQLNVTKYSTNSLLFQEGEECNSLGVILSGELTISTLTSLDKEYTINILHKNDIFGENLLFNKSDVFLGDGIITKDAEILFIPKNLLIDLFSNKTFLINYLSIISEKNTKLRERMKLLSQKSIADRIMFYLINEYKKTGNKKVSIISKEDLANKLNIPRPSLSRELINLKDEGLIDYNRYFITLLT